MTKRCTDEEATIDENPDEKVVYRLVVELSYDDSLGMYYARVGEEEDGEEYHGDFRIDTGEVVYSKGAVWDYALERLAVEMKRQPRKSRPRSMAELRRSVEVPAGWRPR